MARGFQCFGIYMLFSLGALFLTAQLTKMVLQYTPLFRKVECRARVDSEFVDDSVEISMKCANFSPISFDIGAASGGELVGQAWLGNIGSDKESFSTVSQRTSRLPADGLGSIVVRINSYKGLTDAMGEKQSEEGHHIFMRFGRKMHLRIPDALSFLRSEPIVEQQWCGLKFPSFTQMNEQGKEPGALKCAGSEQELMKHTFTLAGEEEHVQITAAELGVDLLEVEKDVILGFSIVIAFTAALVFMFGACTSMFKAGNQEVRGAPRSNRPGEIELAVRG